MVNASIDLCLLLDHTMSLVSDDLRVQLYDFQHGPYFPERKFTRVRFPVLCMIFHNVLSSVCTSESFQDLEITCHYQWKLSNLSVPCEPSQMLHTGLEFRVNAILCFIKVKHVVWRSLQCQQCGGLYQTYHWRGEWPKNMQLSLHNLDSCFHAVPSWYSAASGRWIELGCPQRWSHCCKMRPVIMPTCYLICPVKYLTTWRGWKKLGVLDSLSSRPSWANLDKQW